MVPVVLLIVTFPPTLVIVAFDAAFRLRLWPVADPMLTAEPVAPDTVVTLVIVDVAGKVLQVDTSPPDPVVIVLPFHVRTVPSAEDRVPTAAGPIVTCVAFWI